MTTELLPEKYRDRIYGVLDCYDRVVLTGTLPLFCHAQGMTSYLYSKHIRIYFNGHSLLAYRLRKKGLAFEMHDNAFFTIADFATANELAQDLHLDKLHRQLDRWAMKYCPVIKALGVAYHWSIMQCEYTTDMVFTHQRDLQEIYSLLVESLIHSVKPENIASFLGQKLHGNYQGETGNDFNARPLSPNVCGYTRSRVPDPGLVSGIERVHQVYRAFEMYRFRQA